MSTILEMWESCWQCIEWGLSHTSLETDTRPTSNHWFWGKRKSIPQPTTNWKSDCHEPGLWTNHLPLGNHQSYQFPPATVKNFQEPLLASQGIQLNAILRPVADNIRVMWTWHHIYLLVNLTYSMLNLSYFNQSTIAVSASHFATHLQHPALSSCN